MIQKNSNTSHTLPNVEIFALSNCIVNYDSLVDELESKERSVNITQLRDNASLVGLFERPIYRLNASGDTIQNVLCNVKDFYTVEVGNNDTIDGDVVLEGEITFDSQLDSEIYTTYYYNDLNLSSPNKFSVKVNGSFRIAKSMNTDLSECVDFYLLFTAVYPKWNKITSLLKVYINNEYVGVIFNLSDDFNKNNQDQYMTSAGGVISESIYNKDFILNKIDLTKPMHIKLCNCGSGFNKVMEKRNFNLKKFNGCKLSLKYGSKEKIYGRVLGTSDRLTIPTDLNNEDLNVILTSSDNSEIFKNIKACATPLIRTGCNPNTGNIPEKDNGVTITNVTSYKYCIIYNMKKLSNTSIQITLNHGLLNKLRCLPNVNATDYNVLDIEPIYDDGSLFVTEKPNLPIE